MIGGEAGVGKSRLVSEFAERSRGAGVRALMGGCLELGADGLPFAPFTSALRELVRDLGAAGVAELLPGGAARELARLLRMEARVSVYGSGKDRDGGFTARHPGLATSTGTIRLRPEDAAGISDEEFLTLGRAALAP